MAKEIIVSSRPKCDFCEREAEYDAKTVLSGAWANMCLGHFKQYGCGRLGTGFGQHLKLGTTQEQRDQLEKTS